MKSKKLKTFAQLLITVCLVTFTSCKKEKGEKPFKITIDDIEITFEAAVPHVGDSVSIRLHGYIGPNKCYRLYDVLLFPDSKGGSNDFIIEAYGIYEENKSGDPCMPEESLLNYEMKVIPESSRKHTFKAIQSDASVIEETLVVE